MNRITQLFTFAFGLLLVTTGSLFAQSAPNLTGTWKDIANPERQLELHRANNNTVNGTAVNDQKHKAKNGKVVLKDLSWNSQANAYEGSLLNPDGSDQIPVTVRVTGNDAFEFKVKNSLSAERFALYVSVNYPKMPHENYHCYPRYSG